MSYQIDNNRKVILVLGVGGHGSSALIDLLLNPEYKDYEIHIVLGVDDSGGTTGELQRTLVSLGRRRKEVIPMGDLRANLERFIFFRTEDTFEAKKLFEIFSRVYKGNNEIEFINRCNEIWNTFFENEDGREFEEFCKNYFKEYQKNNTFSNKHKIGNILLNYLYLERANCNELQFFEILKDKKLIPENIFPHFIMPEALELRGEIKGSNGKILKGEDAIDNSKVPIDPSSLSLFRVDDTNNTPIGIHDIAEQNTVILDLIEKADLILFSTGSIANLLGQIHILDKALVLTEGLIFWLGNIAKTSNEVELQEVINHLVNELQINPFILHMQLDAIKDISALDSAAIGRYSNEGKSMCNIATLVEYLDLLNKPHLILPVLQLVIAYKKLANRIEDFSQLPDEIQQFFLDNLGSGGIKYNTLQVSTYAVFALELHFFLEKELLITEKSERMQIFSSFFQLLLSSQKDWKAEVESFTKMLKDNSLETTQKLGNLITKVKLINPENLKKTHLFELINAFNPQILKGLNGNGGMPLDHIRSPLSGAL